MEGESSLSYFGIYTYLKRQNFSPVGFQGQTAIAASL
jgi:hypothetical protein